MPMQWSMLRALARAGGFAAVLPSFGLAGRGVRSRVLLAVVLTFVITTSNQSASERPRTQDAIVAMSAELAIGFALGFTLRVVLSAIQMIAQLVEQQVGLPRLGDADDDDGSALSRLYQIVSLAVFVSLSGHRAVIAALLHVPDAGLIARDAVTWTEILVRLVTAAWCLAIQSALPLVLSLLTAQLAAGMIARILPQLGGSAITMPMHVFVGLALILLSLATVSLSFCRGIDWAMSFVHGP
jgi:flagellar biosynthetic protein FliR